MCEMQIENGRMAFRHAQLGDQPRNFPRRQRQHNLIARIERYAVIAKMQRDDTPFRFRHGAQPRTESRGDASLLQPVQSRRDQIRPQPFPRHQHRARPWPPKPAQHHAKPRGRCLMPRCIQRSDRERFDQRTIKCGMRRHHFSHGPITNGQGKAQQRYKGRGT